MGGSYRNRGSEPRGVVTALVERGEQGGNAARRRPNNFDALRLYAALMVIYGHGFNMAGLTGPGLWGVPFARVGLDVFFAISGYLVTDSWRRQPVLSAYLANRVLRLLPGLVVCVVLTAFVLGPLVSSLPVEVYFRRRLTYSYLGNIVLSQHLSLPEVFEKLHFAGQVNGSLWSLLPESLCYLTVPLLALVPLRPRLWALGVGGVACGIAGLWLFEGYSGPDIVVWNSDLKYALVEVPFFFVGSLYRLLETRVRDLFRADVALLCLTANWSVASWLSWWNIPLEWVTLPYMVITFGRLAMPVIRQAARFGDFSYGMYLYAFPVQQVVLLYLPSNPWAIPVCVAATLPLAILSWHLVEKPTLRHRRRGALAGGASGTAVEPAAATALGGSS